MNKYPWNAFAYRFTAFSPSMFSIADDQPVQMWELMTGESPAKITKRPREGISVIEGEFNNALLHYEVQLNRLTWIISQPDIEADIPSLGMLEETLEGFQTLIDKWLSTVPEMPFLRIAFGAILRIPVENAKMGNEILADLLKESVKIDVNNSNDFLYRVNRLTNSKVYPEPLLINRLATWKLITKLNIALQFSSAGSDIDENAKFATQLELDINTAGDNNKPLSNTRDLFKELVDLGIEIANSGDIP